MEDDNIIGEFKNCNPKLMEYLTMEKFETLVKYITEEPEDENDKLRAFKFPFVSCELLTTDVVQVYEAFFNYQNQPDSENSDEEDEDEKPPERVSSYQRDYSNENQEEHRQEPEPQDHQEYQENDNQPIEVVPNAPEEKQEPHDRNERKESLESQESGDSSEQNKSEEENKVEKRKKKKVIREPTYLLEQLFNFVDTDKEVNITLAGYFNKVISSLYNKRETDLIDFVYSHSDIVINVSRQLHSKSISEVMTKFICFETTSAKDNYFQQRCKTLSHIISLFQDEFDIEVNLKLLTKQVMMNSSQIVQDVIIKHQSVNKGRQLFDYLNDDQYTTFIDGLCSDKQSVILYNANVLNTLVSQLCHYKYQQDNQDADEQVDYTVNYDHLVKYFCEKVEHLVNYLRQSSEMCYQGPSGQMIEPLGKFIKNLLIQGPHKLKIIELFGNMLKLQKGYDIGFQCSVDKFYECTMELFLKYETNNLLHGLIERIYMNTFESDSMQVRRALIGNAQIIQFFMRAVEQQDILMPNKNIMMRKSYLGYITRIANSLDRIMDKEEDNYELLNEDQYHHQYDSQIQLWQEFKNKYLIPTNYKDDQDLGGHSTKKVSDDNIKVDFDKDSIKNKYSSFLDKVSQQQVTSKPGDKEENEPDPEQIYKKKYVFRVEEVQERYNPESSKNQQALDNLKNTSPNKQLINENNQINELEIQNEKQQDVFINQDPFAEFEQNESSNNEFNEVQEKQEGGGEWENWQGVQQICLDEQKQDVQYFQQNPQGEQEESTNDTNEEQKQEDDNQNKQIEKPEKIEEKKEEKIIQIDQLDLDIQINPNLLEK